MKAYKFFLLSGLILISGIFISSNGQSSNLFKKSLTGNLQFDSNIVSNDLTIPNKPNIQLQNPRKKSRFLAGLLSAIVPGAGEFYSEHYLKAAIFAIVEASAITTAVLYNNRGSRQTDFFQNYADANWYVSKYAYWALKHAKEINSDINPNDYHIFRNVDVGTINPNTANWKKLNGDVDWIKLNEFESALGSNPQSGGFTHRLPYHGEQQYYELIGKYYQYSMGWRKTDISNSNYAVVPPQMTYYAHQRGLANDYFNTGEAAVVFIYLNHVLSMFDAVWSTDRYNDSLLAMNFRIQGVNYAGKMELIPTLNMSYNF
ncbi:MAG TPA: hypothetical protein ENI61_04500 [Ignavibacteria bacterium]|nr:hypothetical protein [Ignavibacteria bacterium]